MPAVPECQNARRYFTLVYRCVFLPLIYLTTSLYVYHIMYLTVYILYYLYLYLTLYLYLYIYICIYMSLILKVYLYLCIFKIKHTPKNTGKIHTTYR